MKYRKKYMHCIALHKFIGVLYGMNWILLLSSWLYLSCSLICKRKQYNADSKFFRDVLINCIVDFREFTSFENYWNWKWNYQPLVAFVAAFLITGGKILGWFGLLLEICAIASCFVNGKFHLLYFVNMLFN